MGESGYFSIMPRNDSNGSRQVSGSLYSRSNLSTSAVVAAHRKSQMENLRKKFGEYGEPYRVGEYKDFRMYYDSGDPSMFWLYADTKSLNNLQLFIQKSVKKKTVGDGGGEGVREGSLVLARYHVDKLVYRAKVENIKEDVFSVRYIDYGNKGENLPRSDIYSWDTILDMIPPQAVSCTLHTLNRASGVLYIEEQLNEFTTFMKASSPMQMTVHQRLTSLDMNTINIGPDIVVSLRSQDGKNILSTLSLFPGFKGVFSLDTQTGFGKESTSVADLPGVHNLTVSNVNKLDNFDPFKVPPPLHLDGATLAQVYQDEPTSPLYSEFTRKAVEKVHWWLNRTEDTVEPTMDDDELKKERDVDHKFTEPEFLETENTIVRANLLSEARKKLHEDNGNVTSGSSPVTSRPKRAKPCRPVSVFPSVDVRVVEAPASKYTPPTLPMQEVELDANGEFQFMMSAIVRPEEIYIHPIQASSGDLVKLEKEMSNIMKGDKVAKNDEVMRGSVWAVWQDHAWLRMEVISRSGFNSDRFNMRSIDYGHNLRSVDVHELNRLPPGNPSTLRGIAVKCHLVEIKLSAMKDNLANKVLSDCLGGEKVHNAIFVEKKKDSIGVVIMLKEKESYTTVNKRLVDIGCATSSFFGGEDEGDGCMFDDWDPMADDYHSNTNNYLTNDDDLEIATDGYKSKDKVCAFYTNKGRCYKGDYCEDKHAMPREGAVTTDQEEVIINTVDELVMPTTNTTVWVTVTWTLSPSAFYITFPHGVRDISTLQQSDFGIKHHLSTFIAMKDSMQEFYRNNRRKHFMDSLPAPGSLIVAKSDMDKLWNRARVRDCSEGEIEVFFVDLGKVEVVTLSNTRKLESCFSVLPFQAVLACIAGIEPVGQSWCKEATQLFKKITSSPHNIAAKVLSYMPGQPLEIDLCVKDMSEGSKCLSIAQVLQEKSLAKAVLRLPSSKIVSVHIPG